jgi:hypothetical protein
VYLVKEMIITWFLDVESVCVFLKKKVYVLINVIPEPVNVNHVPGKKKNLTNLQE